MTHDRSDKDLSPMLAQPADNAPMISGQITQIIEDARGAYLSGRFDDLTLALHPVQQQRLHKAMVHQAIWHLQNQMLSYEFALPLRMGVQVARWWINEDGTPSAILLDALVELDIAYRRGPLVEWHPGDRLSRIAVMLGYCIAANKLIDVREYVNETIHRIVRLEHDLGFPVISDMLDSVKLYAVTGRWQLEAAWTILQGKQPPPFGAFL